VDSNSKNNANLIKIYSGVFGIADHESMGRCPKSKMADTI